MASVRAVNTGSDVKAIELSARIYRACPDCGTSNPAPHNPLGKQNDPWDDCPNCGYSGTSEDKGVIAYWHRNPLMRLWHWAKTKVSSNA